MYKTSLLHKRRNGNTFLQVRKERNDFEVSLCPRDNTSAISESSLGSLKGNEGNRNKDKPEGGESSKLQAARGEKWMCTSFTILSNGAGENQKVMDYVFIPNQSICNGENLNAMIYA